MSKEPDNELRALYTYVRAGINPDNGELHITEDEFIKRIEARVDAKVKEAQQNIYNQILTVKYDIAVKAYPETTADEVRIKFIKQITELATNGLGLNPTNIKREEG